MALIFGGGSNKSRPKSQRQGSIPAKPAAAKPASAKPAAKPAPAKKSATAMSDLGDFFREFKELMTPAAEDKPAVQQAARPLPAAECDYCTGEAEAGSVFTEPHTAPASPLFIKVEHPTRDVATFCRELQLNPLQQAVVWKEVLDKPVALRRK